MKKNVRLTFINLRQSPLFPHAGPVIPGWLVLLFYTWLPIHTGDIVLFFKRKWAALVSLGNQDQVSMLYLTQEYFLSFITTEASHEPKTYKWSRFAFF